MARKRGGLAGLWDRNKGAIKTLAPAALSFIPGVGIPLAAAAGAAMEGFDRPGKAGIGFDPFKGAMGGAKGFTTALGTQSAAQGLKGMLTGGGSKAGSMAMQAGSPPPFDFSGYGIGTNPITNPLDVTQSPIRGLAGLTDAAGDPLSGGGRMGDLLRGAKQNWDVISGAAKGIGGAINYQQQRRLAEMEAEREAAAQRRSDEEFALRKSEIERQRASRERLTQLLLPLLAAQMTGGPTNRLPQPEGR